MGHLTRIANMVVQNLEKGPVQAQISVLIKGKPTNWAHFSNRSMFSLRAQRQETPLLLQSCQKTAEVAGRALWMRP